MKNKIPTHLLTNSTLGQLLEMCKMTPAQVDIAMDKVGDDLYECEKDLHLSESSEEADELIDLKMELEDTMSMLLVAQIIVESKD